MMQLLDDVLREGEVLIQALILFEPLVLYIIAMFSPKPLAHTQLCIARVLERTEF